MLQPDLAKKPLLDLCVSVCRLTAADQVFLCVQVRVQPPGDPQRSD